MGGSLSLRVATSDPLDQFIVNHPEYFFGQSPESGLVNPDNLLILMSHLKCAAFELPFQGRRALRQRTASGEMLDYLEEERVLHHSGDRWHWMSEAFPAEKSACASPRGTTSSSSTTPSAQPRVIGEMDRFAAPMLIHEEAIYLHGGEQYQVEKLDYENKKAYVRQVDVDYYTDANLAVNLRVLDEFERSDEGGSSPRPRRGERGHVWRPSSRRSSFTPTRTSARGRSTSPRRRCTPPPTG